MQYGVQNNFSKKVEEILKMYPEAIEKAVVWGNDRVMQDVIKNISGPGIHPSVRGKDDSRIGKTPIPRRTSNLSNARFTTVLGRYENFIHLTAIGFDERIAGHVKDVHEGNRYTKPRRYLSDPIRLLAPAVMNKWNYELTLAIRRTGQKVG